MRAPLSSVQMTRSGLRISMSCPASIAPAPPPPGPWARRGFDAAPSYPTGRPPIQTSAGPSKQPAEAAASDAAAFRRTAAVMRNRRHIADRGDRKPDRLQRAQSRLSPRARSLHLDIEGAHAVFHGLLAGILGGDLRRIGRRFARALEPLAAG